jgi:hypothetical protein
MNAVQFYDGHTLEGGLNYEAAMNFREGYLEGHHSYIQWLFPTNEPSMFNIDAPILDDMQIAQFRVRTDLRYKMLMAFEKMLDFYGFTYLVDSFQIVPKTVINPDTAHWLCYGDHNYLRITRILKSLKLCGLGYFAHKFYEALTKVYEQFPKYIGENTFGYWTRAVTPATS